MSLLHSPKIVTNGLVLCLDAASRKSYPGTGNVWRDLSGNGNDGTLTNGPTFSSANRGNLGFNGNNQYINLKTGLNLSTNDGFSMCLFLNQNSSHNNSTWNYFYTSMETGKSLEIGTYGTTNTTFIFKENVTNSSVFSQNIVSSWSYIVFGTYKNTRLPFIHTFNSTGYSLMEGAIAFGNFNINFERLFRAGITSAGGDSYYGARCGNIASYNRNLTIAEIQQNFNATKSRFGLL
jgi:hypothetical protein